MANALRYRDYRIFLIGSLVSRNGEDMQEVAEDWLVFVMTGSPFLLGLVAFCKGPSRMLLAPIFGAVIDRVDRKKILIAVYLFQMASALVYGTLVASDAIEFWHILILATLDGLVAPLSRVTRQTVIPNLVPKESLVSAISLNSVGNNTCQVFAPLLGGVLIIWLGTAAVFFINALCFLAIIASLITVRLPERENVLGAMNIRKDISEGFRFVWNRPTILEVMTIQFFSFFFAMPFNRFFPVYAKNILNIGPTGLGLLKGSYAAGNVLGGIGLISISHVKRHLALLRGSSLILTVVLISFALATWLPLSLTFLILTGAANMVFRATALSVIHLNVPDELRGRVMGLHHMELGFRSIGALIVGSLASFVGIPWAIAAGTTIFGLLCIVTPYYKRHQDQKSTADPHAP